MRKNESQWFKIRAGLYVLNLGDRIATAECESHGVWMMTVVHLKTQSPRDIKPFNKYSDIRAYINEFKQPQLFDS